MGIQVREGKFDVVVVASPGLSRWPGLGMRSLATLCAEMDLSVGVFGGDSLRVKGVLPLPSTGAVALIEDSQGRIHRIEGRSLVRIVEPFGFPDPFLGWTSNALLPLRTAFQLRKQGQTIWTPAVAILGTGNQALMLACELLESGVPEVYCIEKPGSRISGWEVHRRRFRMLGGEFIFGTPVELSRAARMLWELRVQDEHGLRVLEVSWVVSAGPFSKSDGMREFPPGSLLFEMEQSSSTEVSEDVEGFAFEEYRGSLLGVRICKALIGDWGSKRLKKERLEEYIRRSRRRIKRTVTREDKPFELEFDGKWLSRSSLAQLSDFPGVPMKEAASSVVASIECIEEVECNLCQLSCPDDAIHIEREKGFFLDASKCTACGKCLTACPARVPVLIETKPEISTSKVVLSYRGRKSFRKNELAILLNRQGASLGSGKVLDFSEITASDAQVGSILEHQVTLEVPSHLVWEARGVRKVGESLTHEEEWVMSSERAASSKVEVQLKNERRLLRDRQPLSLALFETGLARSEDRLLCRDGSCGLCEVSVDGIKQLACQVEVHRGMTVQIESTTIHSNRVNDAGLICPCSGIYQTDVLERIQHGKWSSPDAIRHACGVGEGRCRGRICQELFRRVLQGNGIQAENWIDWRFPWSEWTLSV